MTVFFRRFKILVVAPLAVLLWWVFLRRHPEPTYTTCNELFSKVHEHIAHDAFDNREEEFVGMWASAGALEKETCSFFSFRRRDDSMILGYKIPSGLASTQHVKFTKGEDGVISYYSHHDPTTLLGYIYPLYFDDFPVIGSVECVDKAGFAQWKATVAVPLPLLHNPQTYSLVTRGIRMFHELAPKLGVDIHKGDFYEKPCWQAPVWGKKKIVLKNQTT